MSDIHLYYMQRALKLAERGRLTVSPNPMVGCVIVNDGNIVGEGWHERAGESHAEIHALNQAGNKAKGATVYLTLEPCSHTGRTPPCVNALINAGVEQVYIAMQDPNPLVSGAGIAALQEKNITVNIGLGESEAKKLNEIFIYFIKHQRPFVIAKWAMSLDGKLVTHQLDTREITSEAAQKKTHETRQKVDAILVGSATVLADNPALTTRLSDFSKDKLRHPLRVILATNEKLSPDSQVFNGELPGKTLLAVTQNISHQYLQQFNKAFVEVVILPADSMNQVSLSHLLDALGQREITSLLVEGGRTVHESFIREALVNQFEVYLAPKLIADLSQKQAVCIDSFESLGSDYLILATPDQKEPL